MAPQPLPRLPFAPLARHIPPREVPRRHGTSNYDQTATISTVGRIAELLGVNQRLVYTWRDNGLTAWTADRIACAIGVHPTAIWGELWWWIIPDPEPEPDGRFCGRHPLSRQHEGKILNVDMDVAVMA